MKVQPKIIFSIGLLLLNACGGESGGNGFTGGGLGTAINCAAGTDLCDVWVQNSTEKSAFLKGNQGALLVNVQSVQKSGDYVMVNASGIPNYAVTVTSELIEMLNARPNAASDFEGGIPNIIVDQILGFGEDIGFNSDTTCNANAGYGFWPTSSGCPEKQAHEVYFTRKPTPDTATEPCAVGEGSIGLWVNGTSIYGWLAGSSYNDRDIWHELAPIIEQYDVDICNGHARDGDYHHHAYSSCLAEVAGETETGHSPIYGYAADGYPIYGPWETTGTMAKSSWVKRDYADANSDTGCGASGVRTCLLDNPLDAAHDRTVISSAGPRTSTQVVVASENTFIAESGFYYEDYYWDERLTEQGDEYLDEHNGHADAVHGYHYHVTLDEEGAPVFPYTVGPSFYGKLPAKANTHCGATLASGLAANK